MRRAQMSVYTDWFLADESEAEALGKSEPPFDDWPCLSMKGIIESDFAHLWGLLRSEPESREDVLGEELFADVEDDGAEGGLVIYRVLPEFIDALAVLDKPDIDRIAQEWHQSEDLGEWEPPDVASVLQEMVEFAQHARREGKPVLWRAVW
jgi:hypothetical protein